MGRECESLLESLTKRGSAGPELAAHLAGCPNCQSVRATLESLRARGSVVAPASLVPLKTKIMARLATAAPTATTSTTATSSLGPVASGMTPWLMAIPVAVALAGTLYLSRPVVPATSARPVPTTAVANPVAGSGSTAVTTQTTVNTGNAQNTPVEMSSERTGVRVTTPPARASETRVLPNDDDAPGPAGTRTGPP